MSIQNGNYYCMGMITMTKLEAAANEWIDSLGGPYVKNTVTVFAPVLDHLPPVIRCPIRIGAFTTGALWLLEQATKIAVKDMNLTTREKQPDMRAMELIKRLEELCQ